MTSATTMAPESTEDMTMTDPRGPLHKITDIRYTPSTAYVTMDCGHTAKLNRIYNYQKGDISRCYQCGLIARDELAERIIK